MRRRFLIALPLLAGFATPVHTQPISWGMAQCSALMEVMEGHVSRQPHKGYLADAADLMYQAALDKGQSEGQDATQLGRVYQSKQDEWAAMGYSMAFKTEFRDWVDYCKALARGYDIALDTSMLH